MFQSTGDSLDEDEKGEAETRRNTSYNEVIDADNPQTPEEVRTGLMGTRGIQEFSLGKYVYIWLLPSTGL